MINFHCTIIPVVVLDNVITHTSAWFLDREIHQFFAIAHCRVSRWVFTTRYALNARDLIKESSLLEKKLQASKMLPLSSTVHMYN